VSRQTHAPSSRHDRTSNLAHNLPVFSAPSSASQLLLSLAQAVDANRARRKVMETMLQGLVIIGGLTFSLATSLLIEELIFGRIVRLAFARRPQDSGLGQKTGPKQ
jgi:hypothetical protein